AYNNTYTDSWAATFVSSSYTFYRTGSTTVTADGYGTLTTPDGTFNNVMRVHFVQTYQDSAYISGPIIITYQNDEYMWYLNGNHYPIAAVYTLSSNASSTTTGGFYMSNVVNSVPETTSVLSLSLSPNPANNFVDFNLDLQQS